MSSDREQQRPPNDLDSVLREALKPDEAQVDRVVGVALAAPARRARVWVPLAATLAAAVLIAVVAFRTPSRPSRVALPAPPDVLTISNPDGVVTIASPDGSTYAILPGGS